MSQVRIINRPETEMPGRTLEQIMIARLGSKREYGRFRDAIANLTPKPKKRRKS